MGSKMINAIRIADSATAILQRVKSFDYEGSANNEEWDMRAHIGIEPMLLALSMELALKAWFVFDHGKTEIIRSHNLSKLLVGLKQESQNKLDFEFRQSVAPLHPSFFHIDYELKDLLQHHQTAFVDWRYTHEASQLNFQSSAFIATLEMVLSEFKKRYKTERVPPIWSSE